MAGRGAGKGGRGGRSAGLPWRGSLWLSGFLLVTACRFFFFRLSPLLRTLWMKPGVLCIHSPYL